MKVVTNDLGKRYGHQWVFKGFNCTFEPNTSYAIIGQNGAGKSTLLQTISGIQAPSKGTVTYFEDGAEVNPDTIYKKMALCAPYLELIEELTLLELIKFHFGLKRIRPTVDVADLPDIFQLPHAKNKQIRFYSSGMKQRVRLGLALYSAADLFFIDEPTVNLDKAGMRWYLQEIEQLHGKKLILVSSNDPAEYPFCNEIIDISAFK